MKKPVKLGIIGCGDFLRWQAPALKSSKLVQVASLFDLDQERAGKFAADLGGTVVGSAEEIFRDPEIGMVALFVPPWIRAGLMEQAAVAGKHILTTKPLGASEADCAQIVGLLEEHPVRCGVLYGRSGDAWVEQLQRVLSEKRFGHLALYKQDWLHHYPQWNSWATDPDKNGGPFMDAMIHNLNAARYLAGQPLSTATWFSDTLNHKELKCRDTEMLKLDFEGGATANLFITWAADLNVMSTSGNDREHIDLFYLITDQGWRLTKEYKEDKVWIKASRAGQEEWIPAEELPGSVYDRFAIAIAEKAPNPSDVPTIEDAAFDIRLLRRCKDSFCRLNADQMS